MWAASPIRRSSRSSAMPATTRPSSTWSTRASTCATCSSWCMAAERVGITPIVRTPGLRSRLHPAAARHGRAGHPGAAHQRRAARRARRWRRCATRRWAIAAWPARSRASGLRQDPDGGAHGAVQPRDHAGGDGRGPARAGRDRRHRRPPRASTSSRWGRPDHVARAGRGRHRRPPEARAAVDRVAEAVRKGGVARLALPMNHPTLPRDAPQLRELGVG